MTEIMLDGLFMYRYHFKDATLHLRNRSHFIFPLKHLSNPTLVSSFHGSFFKCLQGDFFWKN